MLRFTMLQSDRRTDKRSLKGILDFQTIESLDQQEMVSMNPFFGKMAKLKHFLFRSLILFDFWKI